MTFVMASLKILYSNLYRVDEKEESIGSCSLDIPKYFFAWDIISYFTLEGIVVIQHLNWFVRSRSQSPEKPTH